MVHYKKILVPLDDSPLAGRALDAALSMAERFEASVVLLEVRKDAAPLDNAATPGALDTVDEDEASLLNMAKEVLGKGGHQLPADRISAEVRSGAITAAIVDAATEHMVDLIVMGTHGRKGITEMFTGSTTEQVMARTSASVLTVKPEGFPYLRD